MNRYFDICATTPIDAKVLSFLNEESKNVFGNPSSIHGFGQKSKAIIERARINVAKSINCIPSEIIFTSGGSISNNMALMGTLKKGDHFITSSYEHPAILNVIPFLKKTGVSISLIKPNKDGLVEPLKIKNEINSKTKLVSIMHINNEIGTINPINEISNITKEHGVLFHTDAVQAMGKVIIDMQKGNIDLMSLSGHKFYAPKGVGILYVKDGTHIEPTLFGGGQESDLFPGTENTVNIGAIGLAAKICHENFNSHISKIKELDNYFIQLLNDSKIEYVINGSNRAPGILNISLLNSKSTAFIINLDRKGYAISAGSACASGANKGSHTLRELGIKSQLMEKSYRISFGKLHTKTDIKNLFELIKKSIK